MGKYKDVFDSELFINEPVLTADYVHVYDNGGGGTSQTYHLIQVSSVGTEAIDIVIEGSNQVDENKGLVAWSVICTKQLSVDAEPSVAAITEAGLYRVATTTRFTRLRVVSLTGTFALTMVGRYLTAS